MENLTVFIINLKTSIDRRNYMITLCQENQIDPIFIDAVYGKDLSEEYVASVYDDTAAQQKIQRSLKRGEIGCALSHKVIYEYMLTHNIEQALVLEDDVAFEKDFKEAIVLINKFPSHWDLVLLGHYADYIGTQEIQSPTSFWDQHKLNDTFKLCRLSDYGYGTHAYLINKKGATKLLKAISPMSMPIDLYTGSSEFSNVYAMIPTPIKVVIPFESTVRNTEERVIENVRFYYLKKLIGPAGRKLLKKAYLFFKALLPVKKYDN
ncbi:glycosyltransferase family 25 protein [[Pasteurella] aerogenes]